MTRAAASGPSMYELALGSRYGQLDAEVHEFHRLRGKTVLHGQVSVAAPQTWAGSLLARCVGMPTQQQSGPIRFELDAAALAEQWTRIFPRHTMSSTLRYVRGDLVEELGPASLMFRLQVEQGALVMNLARMSLLGIPCPQWLLPRITAREHGSGGQLHFLVEARVPGVGMVTRYEGHLQLP